MNWISLSKNKKRTNTNSNSGKGKGKDTQNQNDTNTSSEKVDKKPKKSKKEKPVSDDEKPKKVSGYILYSKAKREEAIANIKTENGDEDYKPKSTEVMKELGRWGSDRRTSGLTGKRRFGASRRAEVGAEWPGGVTWPGEGRDSSM